MKEQKERRDIDRKGSAKEDGGCERREKIKDDKVERK